ncbi:MAG: response regulator transcription factor [Reichenbachiella sp.]
MKKRILLVEDDVNLGFVIKDNLSLRGYDVELYDNGKEAYSDYLQNQYDLCLLDIMLPQMDGLELGRKIRKDNPQIPIIFLTAKASQEDKLHGFEIGADDYITKPFSLEELFFRVEVFIRRSSKERVETVKPIGQYSFEPMDYKLVLDGSVIKLTQRESQILEYLYAHKNDVVPRHEILMSLWGEDDYFKGRSLDVFISKLRKYLEADEQVSIENIHGVGFKLSIR